MAAAAGLAAGVLGVGFTPNPAGAAPTVLLECDQVNGTATVSKGITNVVKGQKIQTTSTAITGGCTGPIASITGAPVATNPLSVKLATPPKAPFGDPTTMGISCAASPPPGTYPPSGKGRITFTNTWNGKPITSDSYLALGGLTNAEIQEATGDNTVTTADYPDATKVRGIVTKGAGVGAEVSGVVLYQPVATTGGPIPAPVSTITGGNIVPGFNSAATGLACQTGGATLTGIILGTDGTSLATFLNPSLPSVNSSLKIQFPG